MERRAGGGGWLPLLLASLVLALLVAGGSSGRWGAPPGGGGDDGGGGSAAELEQRQPAALPQPIKIEGELDAKDLQDVAQRIAKQAGLQDVQTGPAVCGPAGCPSAQGSLVREFIAPSNFGGPMAAAVQGAIGSVGRQIAGKVLDSWLSPRVLQPLSWRNSAHGYQSSGVVEVPNLVPPPPDGLQTPVQLNTEVVFPRPKPKTRTIFNPCSKAGAAEEGGCNNGQKDMYDERNMVTRVDAVRRRADERLADARKNWEDEVLAMKQRLRERVQGLKQRADAIENQVRRLEAGGGRRMDLPQYVRVRNRVAGVSDAVAKLIADDNLLQERMDHVLEAPGPRGRAGQLGVQGARGMPGVPGPRGLTGAKGNAGLPGKNGDNGPPGPPGAPGVIGRRGLRAIQGSAGCLERTASQACPVCRVRTERTARTGGTATRGRSGPRATTACQERLGPTVSLVRPAWGGLSDLQARRVPRGRQGSLGQTGRLEYQARGEIRGQRGRRDCPATWARTGSLAPRARRAWRSSRRAPPCRCPRRRAPTPRG